MPMTTYIYHPLLMQISVCIVITVSLSLDSFAQEDIISEELWESSGQFSENSPYFDAYEYYARTPIRLRTAAVSEIARLPGFTPAMGKTILSILSSNDTLSLSMLADSLQLSPDQRYILYQCTVISADPFILYKKPKAFTYRARLQQDFSPLSAVENAKFRGSSDDIYQRFLWQQSQYSVGAVFSKDGGESSLTEFISGAAEWHNAHTEIIIGDFTAQYGLGNIMWRQFGLKKGAEVLAPLRRSDIGLSPYRSANESGFLRGIALRHSGTFADSALAYNCAAWFSSTPRSGTYDSVNAGISSLWNSGLFRTANEQAKKHTFNEKTLGALSMLTYQNYSLGAAGYGIEYSLPLLSQSSDALRGKSGTLWTLFGEYTMTSLIISTEISSDADGALGMQSQVMVRQPNYEAGLALRSFAADFRSPFGYHFGEFSAPSNEQGLYAAVSWHPDEQPYRLSFYADIYRSLRPRYGMKVPTQGLDMLGELQWKFSSGTTGLLRLRSETKTDNISQSAQPYLQRTVTSMRAELRKEQQSIQYRVRCEAISVDFEQRQAHEYGLLSFLELRYSPFQWFRCTGRMTYFSTDSYSSAIWAMEPNVQGILTSSVLYGQGMRYMAMAQCIVPPSLTFTLRYVSDIRNTIATVSEGENIVEDFGQSRLHLQIDIGL